MEKKVGKVMKYVGDLYPPHNILLLFYDANGNYVQTINLGQKSIPTNYGMILTPFQCFWRTDEQLNWHYVTL